MDRPGLLRDTKGGRRQKEVEAAGLRWCPNNTTGYGIDDDDDDDEDS